MQLTKKDLNEAEQLFEAGIDKAVEHVKLIHISTLVEVPEDLRQRLYDATDAGTLVITEDGQVRFTKTKE